MVRGAQLRVQWLDELAARRCQALTVRAEQEAMLAETAKRALTPPTPGDTPITIQWGCAKPTDPPNCKADGGTYHATKQAVDTGYGELLRRWLQ